jgi:hypothetical protein
VTGAGQLTETAPRGLYQGARPAATAERGSSSALALLHQFPPRALPDGWPATVQLRDQVTARLLGEPLAAASPDMRAERSRSEGLAWMLDWLEHQPGDSWQDRWLASGAEAEDNIEWRRLPATELAGTGPGRTDTEHARLALARGMSLLVCGDVIRPSLGWLLTPGTPRDLVTLIARSRDADGFTPLAALCDSAGINAHTSQLALRRIAIILAAKGGGISDIVVGDCLELLRTIEDLQLGRSASPSFRANARLTIWR